MSRTSLSFWYMCILHFFPQHKNKRLVSNYIKTIEKGIKEIKSTIFEPCNTTSIIQTFHFFL